MGTQLGLVGLAVVPIMTPVVINAQSMNQHQQQNVAAYQQRSTLLLDVARQHLTKAQVIAILEQIDPKRFPMVELHLADNEGCSFESRVLHNHASATVFDRQALWQILQVAKQRGITIIPDVDVPGHCGAIVAQLRQTHSKWLQKGVVMDDQTLDYTNPNTYQFVKDLYHPVIEVFKHQQIRLFNVGCDEVPGNVHCGPELADFLNQINHNLNHDGFTMIVWNDSLATALHSLSRNILVDDWTEQGTSTQQLQQQHFTYQVIDPNTNYINLADANNQQLVQQHVQRFNQQANHGKMLALWGGNNQMTGEQLQLFIKQLQTQIK